MELKLFITEGLDTRQFFISIYKVNDMGVQCTDADIEAGDCVYVASVKITKTQANRIIAKAGLTPEEIVNAVSWEREAGSYVV